MSNRRYKKSPAEDFFETIVKIASLIPWWLTLLAALLLFVLYPFSFPSDVKLEQPTDVVGILFGIIFGTFFKYILPITLFVGGLLNLFKSGKSFSLFKSISLRGALETIQELSWQDFEFLLSEWFKKQGYTTKLVGGGGADGGVDIELYKNGELYLVQCKHYKAWKVSVNVVRELFGVMASENAAGGFVVTSGNFTDSAYDFAQGKNIELIDGKRLASMLDGEIKNNKSQISINSAIPYCPRCGHELVVRSGPRGRFYGCSSYPRCHYTENLN